MSDDLRDPLERARSLAPAPRFDLGSTRHLIDRRAMTRKVGIVAFALVLGLAGLLGTILAFGHSGQEEPGADVPPAPALGPGQYLYRETTRFWVDTCDANATGAEHYCVLGSRDDLRLAVDREGGTLPIPSIEPKVERLWWSATDMVRLWERSPALEFFLAEDRARYVDLYGDGVVQALPPEDRTFAPGTFDPPDYTFPGWSRDPATLALQLERATSPDAPSPVPAVAPLAGQGPSTGAQVRLLDEMLPVATPDFQQALFEAAHEVPGIEVIEGTTDPAGRTAVALRIVTEGQRRTWFFDPSSHLVLGGTTSQTSTGFLGEAWYVSELAIVRNPDIEPNSVASLVPAVARPTPRLDDPRSL